MMSFLPFAPSGVLAAPSVLAVFSLAAVTAMLRAAPGPRLDIVAEFPNQQVTGVAVSASGRIFVNFPFWSDDHTLSVAELGRDGHLTPYPDEAWNAASGAESKRFVCVQSVYVDAADMLWILDAGSPKMEGVVEGGPKLLRVNLTGNQIEQVIQFPRQAAPAKSYLNDVRVDIANQFAFLTDSGLGALVIVNLRSGAVRRVLADHPSVKPEPGFQLVVEGNHLVDQRTGQPPALASDGLALDAEGGYLYFKALTGHALYRVPIAGLENEQSGDAEIAATVEKIGDVPASDGLEFRSGRVYITAIEDNAVVRYVVGRTPPETWVKDERLKWPDSLAWGPDGSLYVTTSQIHLTPRFNQGANRVREPFRLFKIAVSPPVQR